MDNTKYLLVNSVTLIKNSNEIYYSIGIGLFNSDIEDEVYIVDKENKPEYICKDINEFIDSISDENGNKIEFNNDTYSSDQLIENDIVKVEQTIGFRLPDGYKKFLLETSGGIFAEPFIIDSNTSEELHDKYYETENRIILNNKYMPKLKEMNSQDYTRENFALGDILNYWSLLKGEDDIDYNFQAINEKQIIPIGLNGDSGIFFIGAKGSENENKIYFYDYVLGDNGEDYNPDAIELLCDSFEEYINGFYFKIPDNISYTFKSNAKYWIPG